MPCLPNLGSKAPDFTVNTTFGPINLSDYCGKMGSIILPSWRLYTSMHY